MIFEQSHAWWDDVNGVMVVYIALPEGVDECVTVNEDGSYTVFISTDICPKRQKDAYNHALCHIRENHLEDGIEVGKAEIEARKAS